MNMTKESTEVTYDLDLLAGDIADNSDTLDVHFGLVSGNIDAIDAIDDAVDAIHAIHAIRAMHGICASMPCMPCVPCPPSMPPMTSMLSMCHACHLCFNVTHAMRAMHATTLRKDARRAHHRELGLVLRPFMLHY